MFASMAVQNQCRYAKMPACETDQPSGKTASMPALGVFQLRKRDVLDFGIDLTEWIAANGNPEITEVAWAVTADSPKTPIIVGQAFDKTSKALVTLKANITDDVGATYYLEATISFGATAAAAGYPAIPARSLVRRINIILSNG